MPSLLIKDVFLVKENEKVLTNIYIENGKISDFKERNADRVIDASGLIALPGMIDCHVHCREPGFTQKEDYFTASCAAAAGGVTTIIDMPNTNPQTITVQALEKKRKLAEKSIVNYGFHFGTDGKNLEEIKKAQNIASIKVYMDVTTGNMILEDMDVLKNIFFSRNRIMAHAEGRNVGLALDMIKQTGNHLHCAHISLQSEIELLRRAKAAGINVTVEVTPHHLFLSKDDVRDGFRMMKPSLKSKNDVAALWKATDDGLVDTIGSDHAPHTKREKQSKAPPFGVPGLETTLPLLLDTAGKGRITLQKIIELTAGNPAIIFNIENKGKLEVGFDADIVLVDLSLEKEVRNDRLFTKCKWSPFAGRKLMGWPVYTIVNGNPVFEKGKIDVSMKGREVVFQS